ncbi:hypothetical protein COCOBI_pt-0560 (chloroplast) [Coccomyxa sp. Obi]|nr:hypothetical protein COCOBI_pt-0560 [Coccomyxa sp. Obi]
MKLKSKVTSALAIVVFVSFSFFPRKACAMKQPPEPSLAHFMPKEEVASPSKEFLPEIQTPVKASDISKQPDVLQQETKLDKTLAPSPSDQELIGAGESLALRAPSLTHTTVCSS